jgi:Zn-finger nucleic acid-binding protein
MRPLLNGGTLDRLRPVHCPHCSKPVSSHLGNCVHCGRPSQVEHERSRAVIPCARCRVDAEIISLGPVDVDSCAACGNIWFDNSELERAAAAADGATGADLRDAVRSLVSGRPRLPGPSVVPCPFCSIALVRRIHPTVPDVVAHVCFTHGAWIEGQHLLKLVEDLETQGLVALRARGKLRAARAMERDRHAVQDLDQIRRLSRRHIWFWFF